MPWIDVETDHEPFVIVAGSIGLAFGAGVWWYSGFWDGCAAYFGVAVVLFFLRSVWLQAHLSREARRAAKTVLAWFRERFPDERVESVAVRAVEPERYIIAVRHGFGMPTPRRYFAIARPDLSDIVEVSVGDWWPRGLK